MTYIQTVAKEFSRRREREPSISGTLFRLNVLDHERAEQGDRGGEIVGTTLS